MTDKSWYERGELPPVGTVCDYHGKDAEIVAHLECGGRKKAVYQILDLSGCGYTDIAHSFKPVKSDRDKAIEKACEIWDKNLTISPKKIFEEMYDAGLLRLPEQK